MRGKQTKLSADAYSGFDRFEPNKLAHRRDIDEATAYLLDKFAFCSFSLFLTSI
jgi:hypothetical protein